MVVLLAGGTGGARLARGLLDVADALTVIANTGDDVEIHGGHVSPDPDLITFWLADRIDARGWGLAGSFAADFFVFVAAGGRPGSCAWPEQATATPTTTSTLAARDPDTRMEDRPFPSRRPRAARRAGGPAPVRPVAQPMFRRMNEWPSRHRPIASGNRSRHTRVAAARAGRARPNASMVMYPS